ncbi:MAG: 30S ribosomal protein S21 [Verrucomicrobiaceae bacterium]|nr:MAG: 30S ribosomal protein S21 [Verrucomicrobiaceae bacterium]
MADKHRNGSFENKRGLCVDVRNGSVEGAIRLLGRKVKQEGLIREVRQRQFFEKPSTVKRRRRAEAVVRLKKAQARRD